MNNESLDAILTFDTLYTTNHIQILKLLLPFVEKKQKNDLAVYIKFLEFQYTLEYSKKHPILDGEKTKKEVTKNTIKELLKIIKPYCTKEELSMMTQLNDMMSALDMYEEISAYLPMLQQFNSMSDSNSNPEDMLKNLLTPEQVSMFELFKNGGTL
ncbi:MAG: hypothetical protein ACRC7V_03400 [Lachnospiraceae bacterium]